MVCAELAARLQVSEHTIRRDLHELSREGFCKKVYGGAVLSLPEAGDYSERKIKIEQQNSGSRNSVPAGEARRHDFRRYRDHQSGDGRGATASWRSGGNELPGDRRGTGEKTVV